MWRARPLLFLAILLGARTSLAQSGGTFTITQSAIVGSVQISSGGVYTLIGSIGEPEAGSPLTGGSYSVTGGFLSVTSAGLRGDAVGDGTLDVVDVLYLINYILLGGPPPATPCGGDANFDGAVTLSDIFYLLDYLFAGGPAPSPC